MSKITLPAKLKKAGRFWGQKTLSGKGREIEIDREGEIERG